MPRGKKKTQKEPSAAKVLAEAEELVKPALEKRMKDAARQMVKDLEAKLMADACNHQNKHYTAGELRCVLPKKHGGDHFGYVNGNPTAWSDAAGTPTRKHA